MWRSLGRSEARLLLGALVGCASTLAIQRLRRRWAKRDSNADVVALFCNPKMPRSLGLTPLSFGQDLKFMLRALGGLLYVEPAASLYTARRAIVNHRPKIILFSGHVYSSQRSGAHLCFETPDGLYDDRMTTALLVAMLQALSTPAPHPPSEAATAVEAHLELQQTAALQMQHCSRAWMEAAAAERAPPTSTPTSESNLASSLASKLSLLVARPLQLPAALVTDTLPPDPLSRLTCIVLNACSSIDIGMAIVSAFPHVAVVCWSTVTEDSAARAFLVGFMTKLAAEHEHRASAVLPGWLGAPWAGPLDGLDLVMAAFEAGCASFAKEGFQFGNPADWLHPPGHEHWRRPRFKTCRSCAPPVQGRAVLLHRRRDGTGIEELYGGGASTPAASLHG